MLGLFFSFLWTLWELSTKSIFKITVLNNIPNNGIQNCNYHLTDMWDNSMVYKPTSIMKFLQRDL